MGKRRMCHEVLGLFGLLDENLMLSILTNIDDRIDRQAWCLVCTRFLELDALSRKRVKLFRVDVLEKVLIRCSNVEYLDLSPCLEVSDGVLDTVGRLLGRILIRINLSRIRQFTPIGLGTLACQCPNLRELDLSFCRQIDDEGMFSISQLEKLETLKLVNCWDITDIGLEAVAEGCRALRHLSLRWCLGVTDCSISQVVANCKRLESVDLSYTKVTAKGVEGFPSLHSLSKLLLVSCDSVDDACLECLANCSKSLVILDVARCPNVTDRGVLALSRGPVSLRQLSLSYCLEITDGLLDMSILERFAYLQVMKLDGCQISSTELASIGKGCKSLKVFSVSKCIGVTDEGICAVVEGCSNLHELDLTCCRELTDKALASIGRSCGRLLSLKMEACSLVTQRGLADIGNGCQSLELLDLTDCNVIDEGLKEVSKFTALRVLKLAICPKITDIGVWYIAARCYNLLEIDLYRSVSIGDSSVAAICLGCPRLRAMNLSYCDQITDVGLHFVCHLHDLTRLELRSLPLVSSIGMSAVASGCRRLLELDIKRCTAIDDAGLISVAKGCPNLREANLSFCKFTDAGLLAVARINCMQNLKLLHLQNITVEGLGNALFQSGSLKKVKLSTSLQAQLPELFWQIVEARGCRIRWMEKRFT